MTQKWTPMVLLLAATIAILICPQLCAAQEKSASAPTPHQQSEKAPQTQRNTCAETIERSLQALRVLLDNLEIINGPAIQGLASGYLKGTVCSEQEIRSVNIQPFLVEYGYGGTNKSSFGITADYKHCFLTFSIDLNESVLRNIVSGCHRR
jgi:hypothetical protein